MVASTASLKLPGRPARQLQVLPGGLRWQPPDLDVPMSAKHRIRTRGCSGSRAAAAALIGATEYGEPVTSTCTVSGR